ncbi:MAG: ATP-binding protein, partial [Streptosporangiaceae bacterium]
MPRHQTLRAVVDWSWDLLDDAERTLWRRFCVFTGGATLEAAEQVCAGPAAGQAGLAVGQVLDLLTALADKSLITVRHGPDGARYRMLEIIRAYGQERLAEAGERDALREAHARYFVGLAETSVHYLRGAEQLDRLRMLADDQDNVHAAIRAAAAAGDRRTAVRLAAAFGWYWLLRSMRVEGADLVAEVLEVPGDGQPPTGLDKERLAAAYAVGALLAIDTPGKDRAEAWFARASELAAAIPDPADPVRETAMAELAAVRHSAERAGLPQVLVFLAYTTGDMARLEGRHDVARAELLRAMELPGSASMERHLYAKIASGLGYLAGATGDLAAARGWHAEALAATRLTADAPVIGAVLIGLADLALRESEPGLAAELLGASLAIRG